MSISPFIRVLFMVSLAFGLGTALWGCNDDGGGASSDADVLEDAVDADVADAPDAADTASDGILPDMDPDPNATAPVVTIETYPRVDGSTSTFPLAMVIACELLDLEYTWEWDAEAFLHQVVPDPAPGQEDLAAAVVATIVHNRTHAAYTRLVEGDTDLILVASPPSDDEQALADELGVELDWRPVAQDAIVFLLNSENTITDLTAAQVRAIYMGEITQWNEVGGRDAAIHPYSRNRNSGSEELMENVVMPGLEMPDWPDELRVSSMGGLVETVSGDPDGIGFSVFYYITQIISESYALKLCAVDGAVPSPETIGARAYPFTAPVLVVIRGDLDRGSLAYQMRDWLLTPGGQAVVERSGYVPANP